MAVSTFEGLPTGAVTAAAAGFDFLSAPAGGGAQIISTNPYGGTRALQLTTGTAGGLCLAERTALLGASSTGQVFGRARVRLPALPADSTGMRVLVVADSTGAFLGDVRITNAGKVQLRSGAAVTLATSTLTLAADQWVDVGLGLLVFSATVGQLEMRIWDSGGTVAETWTSAASLNTVGAGGTNKAQAGAIRSGVNSFVVVLDDVDWSLTGYPTLIPEFPTAPAGISVPATAGSLTSDVAVVSSPDGLAVPAAVGAPEAAWSGSSAPDGVPIAVALGAPSAAWSAGSEPDGMVVPVSLGDPDAGWSAETGPDGVSVPVTAGAPAVGWLAESEPVGLLVPVLAGSPTAHVRGQLVLRPYTGVVVRAAGGTVARPAGGVVVRP
ncbi:hypothetical protein OG271_04000 [Micromonospora rifamycinica]|uniref:hypothetical protein n=1 Tax=Micromonospora rifamycinica TaxID=291594 RepID=UPI002E2B8209|nr:hypothetical protein [Micromonospora rifamycinica]